MSVLLAAATAAAILAQPECSWNRPGADPYRGTVADAINRYRDIHVNDRRALIARVATGQPDDEVAITRDAISGKYGYGSEIRDMYFGATQPRLCRSVDRRRWTPTRSEPGAVYCVKEQCVLIPRICGNVSRIERKRLSDKPVADLTIPAPPEVPPEYPFDWLAGLELGLADGPGPAGFGEPDYPGEPVLGGPFGHSLAAGGSPANWEDSPAPLAPVPEPSTWAMLLGGLALCLRRGMRRQCAGKRASKQVSA
jgi:hypothetical protein